MSADVMLDAHEPGILLSAVVVERGTVVIRLTNGPLPSGTTVGATECLPHPAVGMP